MVMRVPLAGEIKEIELAGSEVDLAHPLIINLFDKKILCKNFCQ
jgi:hypothetical protein